MKTDFTLKSGILNIRRHRAFSIIEMVITIAIIGILTLFTLMYYIGTIEDTKIAKTKIQLDQIKDACRRYYAETGFYPTKITTLYPKYLTVIPKTPWNTEFQINFGEVTEVSCLIPQSDNRKRKMSLTIDTIGFVPDNYYDIGQEAKAAFSFTKTAVTAASTGETQAFNIDFLIEFKSFITSKTLEHGADFKFQVSGAEIGGLISCEPGVAALRDLNGTEIQWSNLGVTEKTGFEYSSQKASDKIKLKLLNCKRTSGFIFQLYRPVDEGIPMYYGQRKVLLIGPDSAPPVTLTRSMGENTKRK